MCTPSPTNTDHVAAGAPAHRMQVPRKHKLAAESFSQGKVPVLQVMVMGWLWEKKAVEEAAPAPAAKKRICCACPDTKVL